jgi:hypothetical protein
MRIFLPGIVWISVSAEPGIDCIYRTHPEWGFGCDVVVYPDCEVKAINEVDDYQKSHQDVKYVNFTSDTLKFLPSGLHKHLPNIETIYIKSRKLRHINEEDLKDFGNNLKRVIIEDSGIVDIGKDLFLSTQKLVEVSLASERMENVHKNAFDPIKNKLSKLEVSFNCVGSISADDQEDVNNLIKYIQQSCFHPEYRPKEIVKGCRSSLFEIKLILFGYILLLPVVLFVSFCIYKYCTKNQKKNNVQCIDSECAENIEPDIEMA